MFLRYHEISTELEARKLIALIKKSNKSRRKLETFRSRINIEEQQANKGMDDFRMKRRKRIGTTTSTTLDSHCTDYSSYDSTTTTKSCILPNDTSSRSRRTVEEERCVLGEWGIRHTSDDQIVSNVSSLLDHGFLVDNDCTSITHRASDSTCLPKLTNEWSRQVNIVRPVSSEEEVSDVKESPVSPGDSDLLTFKRKRSFLYLNDDGFGDQYAGDRTDAYEDLNEQEIEYLLEDGSNDTAGTTTIRTCSRL